ARDGPQVSSPRLWRALIWQRNNKGRAAALSRLGANVAVEQLDQPLGYCQPEPRAAVLARLAFVELRERIEDPLAIFWPNAWAGIGHGEYEGVVLCDDAELDGSRGRKLHRVTQKIEQDLAHLASVGGE